MENEKTPLFKGKRPRRRMAEKHTFDAFFFGHGCVASHVASDPLPPPPPPGPLKSTFPNPYST